MESISIAAVQIAFDALFPMEGNGLTAKQKLDQLCMERADFEEILLYAKAISTNKCTTREEMSVQLRIVVAERDHIRNGGALYNQKYPWRV